MFVQYNTHMPDSRRGEICLNCYVIELFFERQDKTVKSTFWIFNLCNGEKIAKNSKNCALYSAFRPVFNLVWLQPRMP